MSPKPQVSGRLEAMMRGDRSSAARAPTLPARVWRGSHDRTVTVEAHVRAGRPAFVCGACAGRHHSTKRSAVRDHLHVAAPLRAARQNALNTSTSIASITARPMMPMPPTSNTTTLSLSSGASRSTTSVRVALVEYPRSDPLRVFVGATATTVSGGRRPGLPQTGYPRCRTLSSTIPQTGSPGRDRRADLWRAIPLLGFEPTATAGRPYLG